MIENEEAIFSDDLSVTSNVFFKSNNNNIIKIVREHYLRNDIPCYSKACNFCLKNRKKDYFGNYPKFELSENPNTKVDNSIHYFVLDTNIILHNLDLLEYSDSFNDVIICQTVLEEVKNFSEEIYLRLKELLFSNKRYVFFSNEHHELTYIKRNKNETINDRNDRAITKTVLWYKSHLEKNSLKKIDIILLTNDKDLLFKSQKEGINSMNIFQYIDKLPNSDLLNDLVLSELKIKDLTNNTFNFPDYISKSEIFSGLKNRTVFQGIIRHSKKNNLIAKFELEVFECPLLVIGSKNLNRTLVNDIVVSELLPKKYWTKSFDLSEKKRITIDDNFFSESLTKDEKKSLFFNALKITSKKNITNEIIPTAKVVGLIKRSSKFYTGHIISLFNNQDEQDDFTTWCLVSLKNKALPNVIIHTRRLNILKGNLIVVSIDTWSADSRYPIGHFINDLGKLGSLEAETESLLIENSIDYKPFTSDVLECLPMEKEYWSAEKALENENLGNRQDFRKKLIFSIDPEGCVDIDDALHIVKLQNGNYEVGVHIADVTYFVKPQTPLDIIASLRGNTTYLVNKRIDMLPELLGTNLCSLKPDVDRFSFSVIWELDNNANIINVTFTKSIIRSRKAFSYEEAQNLIDNVNINNDISISLRNLLALSKKLKEKRLEKGAIVLSSSEVKIYTNDENFDQNDINLNHHFETNSLVEEFMLLANISVAEKIYSAFPHTSLLRRHNSPSPSNFETLNNMLKTKNFSLSIDSSKSLADSLDKINDPNDIYFNTLIRILCTRCMFSAEYFISGSCDYLEYLHYGLSTEIYTHFTSPIRRYCDIIVHRQLFNSLNYDNLDCYDLNKNDLEKISSRLNKNHKNSQVVGRKSVEFYVSEKFKNDLFQGNGYVIDCFEFGFTIFIPQFGYEGTVNLEDVGDVETSIYNQHNFELSFKQKNGKMRKIKIFDIVELNIKSEQDDFSKERKLKIFLNN